VHSVLSEDVAAVIELKGVNRRPCLFLALHHIWGKQAPPRHVKP
jgi:hypothetical protein